jgi:hypothetical protein
LISGFPHEPPEDAKTSEDGDCGKPATSQAKSHRLVEGPTGEQKIRYLVLEA